MRHACTAFLLLCIAPPSPVVTAAVTPASQPLDEVEVRAVRLGQLRQQMIRLEDQFFERYNALNTIDDFDTHCQMETRAGTLLERRYCRAVFESKAYEKEAHEYIEFLKKSTIPKGSPANQDTTPMVAPVDGGPPVPMIMAVEARRTEYQQNIRDVVSRHPELIELARERHELSQRYEAARHKMFGTKAASSARDAESVELR